MWYVLNSHAHLLNVLIFEAPLVRYNLPPTIGPKHTSPIIQSTFLLMFMQLVPQCRRPSPHRQEFLRRRRLTSQRPTSPMPLNSWARAFTPISCPGRHTISTTTPLPQLQLHVEQSPHVPRRYPTHAKRPYTGSSSKSFNY